MACACGGNKKSAKFLVTYPDGKKKEFTNEVAASAEAKKVGGTYKKL